MIWMVFSLSLHLSLSLSLFLSLSLSLLQHIHKTQVFWLDKSIVMLKKYRRSISKASMYCWQGMVWCWYPSRACAIRWCHHSTTNIEEGPIVVSQYAQMSSVVPGDPQKRSMKEKVWFFRKGCFTVASQFSAACDVQGMARKNRWQGGLCLKHCDQASRNSKNQTREHDKIRDLAWQNAPRKLQKHDKTYPDKLDAGCARRTWKIMTSFLPWFLSCCPVCVRAYVSGPVADLPQIKDMHKICWRGVNKEALSHHQCNETSEDGLQRWGPFENNRSDFLRNFSEIKFLTDFVRLRRPGTKSSYSRSRSRNSERDLGTDKVPHPHSNVNIEDFLQESSKALPK